MIIITGRERREPSPHHPSQSGMIMNKRSIEKDVKKLMFLSWKMMESYQKENNSSDNPSHTNSICKHSEEQPHNHQTKNKSRERCPKISKHGPLPRQ